MMKRGISLVEIMIASGLLLATMVPLWGLLGSSHQQVVRSAEEIKASQLAAEIMEQLEVKASPEQLPNDGSSVQCNMNSGGVVTIGEGLVVNISHFDEYLLPKLYLSCEEESSSNSSASFGKIVSITIEYKSKEGRDLEYTLRGFVSGIK